MIIAAHARLGRRLSAPVVPIPNAAGRGLLQGAHRNRDPVVAGGKKRPAATATATAPAAPTGAGPPHVPEHAVDAAFCWTSQRGDGLAGHIRHDDLRVAIQLL